MDDCEHKNWSVELDCVVGRGRCYDCKKEVDLTELFNSLRKRMESIIEKYEAKLKE